MRKIISILIVLTLCFSVVLTSCTANQNGSDDTTAAATTAPAADDTTAGTESDSDSETTNPEGVAKVGSADILTLSGPTGMGMAKLMEDDAYDQSEVDYNFTIDSNAQNYVSDIVAGNFQIAAVPTNLAAVLYAKTEGKISIAAINTLGVLYILDTTGTVSSVKDLEGKTIYSSGQGAVPEYALNFVLDAYEINCDVIYEADHQTVVSDIISGKAEVALLPEPMVSAVKMNENAPEGLKVALDMNELWDGACALKGVTSMLYMGCVIVNNSWAEENPEVLAKFLEEYKESVDFVNTEKMKAATYMERYGIFSPSAVAKAAIPGAQIVCLTGEEIVEPLTGFYQILFDANPQSVGGAVPSKDIFYIAEE